MPGLIQLVAVGADNNYFNTNPTTSLYKEKQCERLSLFSEETFMQPLSTDITLQRNSDLINCMHVEFYMDTLASGYYKKFLPFLMLKEYSLFSQGRLIKTGYGELDLVKKLMGSITGDSPSLFYSENIDTLKKWSKYGNSIHPVTHKPCIHVSIPLDLIKNIILIALQFTNVSVRFKFNVCNIINGGCFKIIPETVLNKYNICSDLERIITAYTPCIIPTGNLLTQGVYLDTTERRNYANNSNEKIIRQTQSVSCIKGINETNMDIDISHFKHLVSYLIITFKDTDGNFGVKNFPESFLTLKIDINGHLRENNITPSYYRVVQPNLHLNGANLPNGVYMYSFGKDPLGDTYTGSMNFSRLDHARLRLTFPKCEQLDINVFAVNWNVQKYERGETQLKYE
jgi:hypothetical protein